MKFNKLKLSSNNVINIERTKYEKHCNSYTNRHIKRTVLVAVMLLISVLSVTVGYNLDKSVEVKYVEVETVKEVCPRFTDGSATIITGDTMNETVIILEGK